MLAAIDMSILELVSRFIHVAAVIVAVGGTVFIRFVLHPTAMKTLPDDTRDTLRHSLTRRWARWLHAAIGLILITGIINTVMVFPRHQGQEAIYHSTWGIKVMLALILFVIAIILTTRSPGLEPIRKKTPKLMVINVALATVIVILSTVLKAIPVVEAG